MKTLKKMIYSLIFISLSVCILYGEDEIDLSTITTNISRYEGREISLKLRLKNYDRLFQKITFYDAENIDITFDVEDKKKLEALHVDILNIHEGMVYIVKIRVNGLGALGGIIAELLNFKPFIIKNIP